jgi:hypothetical protein
VVGVTYALSRVFLFANGIQADSLPEEELDQQLAEPRLALHIILQFNA